MLSNGNAAPRGKSNEAAPEPIDKVQGTPCEYLAKAAHWLDLAERNWGEGRIYETAAKLAELNLMMADRTEMLGACGE